MKMRSYRYMMVVVGLGVAVAGSACAASMRGSSRQTVERRAYDNGHREGVEFGADDANHRLEFSYTRHNEYRDGDQGYGNNDGNRDLYRQSLRRGFEAGYTDAFNQAAGTFQRSGLIPAQATSPIAVTLTFAMQVGNRDGVEAGRAAARSGRAYDPSHTGRYRSADHDYDRRYGSRDEYGRDYREAFERGYADGFRGDRR